MRTYEVLTLLSPQLTEDEVTNLIAEFRGVAEQAGAKLASEDSWGRRRLAYPIGKVTEGFYHLWTYSADSGQLSELDRKMKNSDKVMRHMIVRTDDAQKRAIKLAAKNPKKDAAKQVVPEVAAEEAVVAESPAIEPAAPAAE
jgi:small subunit ribosomal protein S6